jgi:hypothetical protein
MAEAVWKRSGRYNTKVSVHNYLQCLGWINAKDSLVCRQGENQEYLSVYDTRILTISIESPLPERLKEARLETGLSQKKLARLCRYISWPAVAEMRLSLTLSDNVHCLTPGCTSYN